jgi:hypothetical protein
MPSGGAQFLIVTAASMRPDRLKIRTRKKLAVTELGASMRCATRLKPGAA